MSTISVLDCTLRDGGYCNQWQFGKENIHKIINGLDQAGIDIVECGFLSQKISSYDADISKYNDVDQVAAFLPSNHGRQTYVCMMNYGEYNPDELKAHDGKSIDGIRVAFHKKDLDNGLELCQRVKEKGYKLFVQAMVSLNYSDEEFLNLIRRCNELHPYAFYIVDSFGVMKRKDLIRLFYLVEHNLDKNIAIGYHSHNNMQLAYSNAQSLVDIHTIHDLILDSSVYGMGRGAGNLNTELFLEYLNDTIGSSYDIKPVLNIIDDVLLEFYHQNYWGYSLPNYLSAAHNAHPNYAGFLNDKLTLTVEDMNEIFDMMDKEHRNHFDKEYIENLYIQYMSNGKVQEEHKAELAEILKEKSVLLVAPGMSSKTEVEKIENTASDDKFITVSVNFNYSPVPIDYIFLSNLRRYRELNPELKSKCIITSNIPADEVYIRTDYRELLNDREVVQDNAGLMAIKFFMGLGVNDIYLAGFDGYSHELQENFGNSEMNFVTRNAVLDAMNDGINDILKEYAKKVKFHFVTKPKYIHV